MLRIEKSSPKTVQIQADAQEPWLNLNFCDKGAQIDSIGAHRNINLDHIEKLQIKVQAQGACLELRNQSFVSSLPRIEVLSDRGYAVVLADSAELRAIDKPTSHNILLLPNDAKSQSTAPAEIANFNFNNRGADSIWDRVRSKIFYLFGYVLTSESLDLSHFKKALKAWWDESSLSQSIDTILQRNKRYDLSEAEITKVRGVIKPGDILLRAKSGYPFDSLLVGTFQHACICLDDQGTVIEAVGRGVRLQSLEKYCQTDSLLVIRPKIPAERMTHLLSYAMAQVGKGYNFSFNLRNDRHYCSGLVYRALCVGLVPERRTEIPRNIHPDDLLNFVPFDLVWTNRPDMLQEVHTRHSRTAIWPPLLAAI